VPDANSMIWPYVLAGLVAAWFFLLFAVWFRLIGQHRATYSAMLSSSFAPRFGMPGLWTTLKFLILRRHRTLGDSRLSFLSDTSLVVLVSHIAILLTLVITARAN
jgi:hypothetical protein